jgi:hypothetical protein
MEHASELAGSVVDAGDFSGGQVDRVDAAAQQDRVRVLMSRTNAGLRAGM